MARLKEISCKARAFWFCGILWILGGAGCRLAHSGAASDLNAIPSAAETFLGGLYGFYHLNINAAQPEILQGVAYPQIYQTAWRGSTTAQLPLGKMLRAMLGDPYAVVESKYMDALSLTWQGKDIDFTITAQTQTAVNALAARLTAAERRMDEPAITMELLHSIFEPLRAQTIQQLQSRYLDYRAKDYEDFSDITIYSSTLPMIASYYGPRVVEISEWQSPAPWPRAVDMNYFNYKKHGTWLSDRLPAALSFYWEDSGQLITPMVIPGSAVTGYQIRDSYVPVDRNVKNPWNLYEVIHKKLIGEFASVKQSDAPIDYAFYKFVHLDQPFIGVFEGERRDGSATTCMMRHITKADGAYNTHNFARQLPYHCHADKPWLVPQISDEPARLIGIITVCDPAHCDSSLASLFKLFSSRGSSKLPQSQIHEIESIILLDSDGHPRGDKVRYQAVTP